MTDTDADKRPPGAADESPASDYSVAVSPRQLAGGFAIIAAILVLLLRSRRRRGRKPDET
jgi:hypothetical protein